MRRSKRELKNFVLYLFIIYIYICNFFREAATETSFCNKVLFDPLPSTIIGNIFKKRRT